ncbi:hypothetical protein Tamer19_02010 [Cupriavidus sp. TA19]|uniref:aldehyde dehydrogenase family protein n=1 Tax=unclassified Cupriavidus TaxID=2640874 RepID=UPI002729409A|nr:aldehyde dehydrogenase family protein [Cupriavidus sp. TA19]GLC90793.1 hypothetical protein Tamer19_02010 [Cupriavidus sp. TA19]
MHRTAMTMSVKSSTSDAAVAAAARAFPAWSETPPIHRVRIMQRFLQLMIIAGSKTHGEALRRQDVFNPATGAVSRQVVLGTRGDLVANNRLWLDSLF